MIDEVIAALDNPSENINVDLPSDARYQVELLEKIAKIKQFNFELLLSIVQSVQRVPFSLHELQEYDSLEDIYDCIYDSCFVTIGNIERSILHAAEFLNLEGLDEDFIYENIEEIIDECQSLDGLERDGDNFSWDMSVYQTPEDYVAHRIRIAILEFLFYEDIDLDEANDWFDEKESLLLEPYYQTAKRLTDLGIY